MKHFLTTALAALVFTLLAGPPSQAQNAQRKTAISLYGSAYQYRGNYGSYFWDLGNSNGGSGINFNRYLTPGLDLGLHPGYVELKGT